MSFVSKEDLTAIFTNLNTKLRKKPTAVRLTQAEYDQLTSEEVHDTTKTYYITDGQGGGGYTLPVASASTLGGIKVGSGLSIDAQTGVLSSGGVSFPSYSNMLYLGNRSYYTQGDGAINFSDILPSHKELFILFQKRPSGSSDEYWVDYDTKIISLDLLSSRATTSVSTTPVRIESIPTPIPTTGYDVNSEFAMCAKMSFYKDTERSRYLIHFEAYFIKSSGTVPTTWEFRARGALI